MAREFFINGKKKETSAEYWKKLPELHRSAELEKLLDSIKFDVLENIFAEYGLKCGIKKENLNFLRPNKVWNYDNSSDPNTVGAYEVERNIIQVNLESIKEKLLVPEKTKEVLLSLLCHEESHAISKNECHITNFNFYDQKSSEIIVIDKDESLSGYDKFIQNGPVYQKFFRDFNEGVVQKLGREIYTKYLERDPLFNSSIEMPIIYGAEIEVVEAAIERIAGETSLDQKTVWEAIINTLLKGDFYDQEIQEGLQEIFSPQIFKELSGYNLFPDSFGSLKKNSPKAFEKFIEKIKNLENNKNQFSNLTNKFLYKIGLKSNIMEKYNFEY